jgi:hypothetical protein
MTEEKANGIFKKYCTQWQDSLYIPVVILCYFYYCRILIVIKLYSVYIHKEIDRPMDELIVYVS